MVRAATRHLSPESSVQSKDFNLKRVLFCRRNLGRLFQQNRPEAMGWTPPHLGILSARLKVRTTVNSEKESTHEAYAHWGRLGQERVSDSRRGSS